MGELDLLKPTIERGLGGSIHFGRVSMKPGKPTTFATVSNLKDPESGARGIGGDGQNSVAPKLIFSLSGNPASALTTAQIFVKPCLDRLKGQMGRGKGFYDELVPMRLAQSVRRDAKREEYMRMRIDVNGEGQIWVRTTGGQRSSRVGSLKGANALVRIEAGKGMAEKGSVVRGIIVDRIG